MLLGDLLAAARRSASAFQTLLEAEDPELAREVISASAAERLSPAAFVRVAVADFDRFANQEDWQTLTSHLRNNGNPGMVCLLEMVRWRLAATRRVSPCQPTGPGPETAL